MSALTVASGPASSSAAQANARSRREPVSGFEPAAQKKILALIERSRAFEDLAESFPALLFALATGHGTAEARARTIVAIESGAPLRQAAVLLGVPMWLRRLPATALHGSLAGLPFEPELAQRLSASVPDDPNIAHLWLTSVGYCCRAADAEFGTWVASWAGRSSAMLFPVVVDRFRLLAAWGWASRNRESALGTLLRRPWSPAIGPRRAMEEVLAWRHRIELKLHLDACPPPGDASPSTALGYEFVPLRTAQEFIAESLAMDNCLDQYGDRLATRRTRIYSVRRDGRVFANLEIGSHEEEPTMPAIRQLRGPRNRRASAEIWRAAYSWLGSQPLRPIAPNGTLAPSPAARRTAALDLWRDYIEDRSAALTCGEIESLLAGIEAGGLTQRQAGGRRRTVRPRRALDAVT